MSQPIFFRSRHRHFLILSLALLLSHNVQANTLLQNMNFEGWYLGSMLGYGMPSISAGNTTVTPESSLVPSDNAHTHKIDAAANLSLMGGAQFTINHKNSTAWFNHYRLGLHYQYQMAEKLTGHGNWNNSPDIYNYTYNVQTQMLLIEGALALYDSRVLEPYLHLGVGMANTTANSYNETSTGYIPGLESHAFSNQTTSGFVGVIGLGVEYNLQKHWRALLSYDYFTPIQANLGSGKTLATGITPAGLKTSIINQAINMGMRYQF